MAKVPTVRPNRIDRDKLRAAIRKMGDRYVFEMLYEAIDLLPGAKLTKLVSRYFDPAQLRPDGKTKGNLLAEVKAFEKASLGGDYYEGFNVNSKNYMEMSEGTQAWIAECERLFDCCVAQAKKGDPAQVREAFDILFALLDHIDEGLEDVIFFADEGGSWQVGVDWSKVLPAWLTCLSATAEPEEYARRVIEIVEKHDNYRRDKHLAVARKIATEAQRKALRGMPRTSGQRTMKGLH